MESQVALADPAVLLAFASSFEAIESDPLALHFRICDKAKMVRSPFPFCVPILCCVHVFLYIMITTNAHSTTYLMIFLIPLMSPNTFLQEPSLFDFDRGKLIRLIISEFGGVAAQEQVNASIMHVLGPVLTPYMDCLEAVMAQYAQDGDDVQMSQDLFADANSVTVLRSTLQECLASLRYFLYLTTV